MARLLLLLIAFAAPVAAQTALLPSSPEAYIDNAQRVRRAFDRPWVPEEGRLGNLRHLYLRAPDCTVRIVPGNENRVFPGRMTVHAMLGSRVLNTDPDEMPPIHDVTLAGSSGDACQGGCELGVTEVTRAPRVDDSVCFTVQLASANDLLVGGDRLTLLIDGLKQPALRLMVNPSDDARVWFENVDIGALAIGVNAPVTIGGTGRVDFLSASSSNGRSTIYLHRFDAPHVGVSTTTTGPRWSLRTGPGIEASYYQPARAPGKIARQYPIEVDGPIEGLDVPAGSVDPQPLRTRSRLAVSSLRSGVRKSLGATPAMPTPDPAIPSTAELIAKLPRSATERVAQVLAKHLPPSVRFVEVALSRGHARVETRSPDEATARAIVPRLAQSGELIHVDGRSPILRDGQWQLSLQMDYSCDRPGQASTCPAGDPAKGGRAYS